MLQPSEGVREGGKEEMEWRGYELEQRNFFIYSLKIDLINTTKLV